MSLINDALKKAQKQRTGESPPLAAMPGIGGEPAARIAHRARPAATNNVPYLQIGAGVGVVLFLIVGSVLLGRFLKREPEEAPPAKPAVVQKLTPKPETVAAAPVKPAPAPSAANTFVLPIVTPANSPQVTPAATAVSGPSVAVAKAPPAPPPEPEPVKPEAPRLKLDSKAINYIEGLRVAGIRASATDSKVLMNDRVYRVGHIVEHEMGLKLTGITANSLSFEDERGASYTRNF